MFQFCLPYICMCILSFLQLVIVLKHSVSSQNFTTSRLRVIKTSTKEQRTIWHIQYTDWHQNGCPKDAHGFLGMSSMANMMVDCHLTIHELVNRQYVPDGRGCNYCVAYSILFVPETYIVLQHTLYNSALYIGLTNLERENEAIFVQARATWLKLFSD